jgi:hypothetical protein
MERIGVRGTADAVRKESDADGAARLPRDDRPPRSPGTDEDRPAPARQPGAVHGDEVWRELADDPAIDGVDLLRAAGLGAFRRARAAVVEPLAATADGMVRLGARILTDEERHPRLADLTSRGEKLREELERSAKESLRGVLRWTVEHAVAALDLTTLVLLHVDLDALAAGLDVDAVVARTDVDAVIDGMDLNAIVARMDVNAIVSRIDLDAVLSQVDLNALLDGVDLEEFVSRVDLNELASRIDLDALLARVDLNEVASRVDVDAILQRVEPDAVVARVDIDAVIERLDLAALAREVIDAIDLPGVLRESSGAVSSEAARIVRAEGMHADDSVARFVDRVLHR